MKRKFTKTVIIIIIAFFFCGWGKVGHEIVNGNTAKLFPAEMHYFVSWSDYLQAHASDADNRKSSDPTEAHKHFIDIDAYPEFVANGRISQSYDSLVAKHGESFVSDQGVLPWAILNCVDSLTNQFRRKDWIKAKQTASDLGHYVADSHMPLHITQNYNGQMTNQRGVHSRYESGMVDKYQSQITITADTAEYISGISNFVFSYIYKNYKYVDSVLQDDKIATSDAGSTRSDAYYQKLWDLTGNFTIQLLSNASHILASLIYTSWVNAGKPLPVEAGISNQSKTVNDFRLFQNYPNPFNPSTIITYEIPKQSFVTLKVYDVNGRLISTLVKNEMKAGKYSVNFNSESNDVSRNNLSSGIYFYKIVAGNFVQTNKMILVK